MGKQVNDPKPIKSDPKPKIVIRKGTDTLGTPHNPKK